MPMQWNGEADARLFTYVLKYHVARVDYGLLARAMGPNVTPKAISHRISKLKEKGSAYEKRNPYAGDLDMRPRGRAKKGCKAGQLTGYEIDDPDDSKAVIKAELKTDPDCKPEMKVFFQPGMGLPVHGAGQAWEGGGMCGFDGLEAFVGGLESAELDDMPLIQMRGMIRAGVKAEVGRAVERVEPGKVKVEVDEFGRPVQCAAGEQVGYPVVREQEGDGGYEAGYGGGVEMGAEAGQMEVGELDGGRILGEGLERVFEEQVAHPEE